MTSWSLCTIIEVSIYNSKWRQKIIRALIGSGAAFTDILINILISIPAVLIAISVHEAAHGYASYKLGDPTAKLMGRVTVNPLAHFDLFGAICMLLFGFGWAKPVPFDLRYLKHPKRDTAIIAAAGPISNFLTGFVVCGIWVGIAYAALYTNPEWLSQGSIVSILLDMLKIIVSLNFSLMIFNLLPIPPLDGSKVLFSLLPVRAHRFILTYERYGMAILMLLLLTSDYLPWFLNVEYYLSWLVSKVFGFAFGVWDWLIGFVINLFV